jgi:hypothetical protein
MALVGYIDPRNEKTTMKRCKKMTVTWNPSVTAQEQYGRLVCVAFVVMDHCSVSCY